MEESRTSRLSQEAFEGAQVREMCKHPGWKIFQKAIDDKITMAKNEWLHAKSKEEAEEIRIKTKHYSEVYDIIKSMIMKGDNARLMLNQILETQNTPSQSEDKEN